jgi:tetratricopeptide (TPR) repeat protein
MSDPLQIEERDFLLRSLDDLDREHAAGDVTDEDYAELRRGYVARTAALQRSITAQTSMPVTASRWRRTVAIIAMASVVAVVLGVGLARSAGERTNADSPTGGVPESVNSMLSKARAKTGEGKIDEAVKLYIDVLKQDPDNAEARTYKGWLLVQLGNANDLPNFVTDGKADLDKAVIADPAYPDARVFRGIVAFRYDNDAQRAVDEFNVLFSLPDVPTQQLAMVLDTETEARATLGIAPRQLSVTPGSTGSGPPTSGP